MISGRIVFVSDNGPRVVDAGGSGGVGAGNRELRVIASSVPKKSVGGAGTVKLSNRFTGVVDGEYKALRRVRRINRNKEAVRLAQKTVGSAGTVNHRAADPSLSID